MCQDLSFETTWTWPQQKLPECCLQIERLLSACPSAPWTDRRCARAAHHEEVVAFSVPQIQDKIAAVIQLVPQRAREVSHGGASRGRAHAARQEKEETVQAVVPIQEQIVARTKSKSKAWKLSKAQNFSFLCVVVFCSREDMEKICWCCGHQQFFFGLHESSPPVVSPSLRLLDRWCLKV